MSSNRIKTGSVVQDPRDNSWRFYWWENGKRKSKTLGQFPTKAKAWAAAKPLRDRVEANTRVAAPNTLTVRTLVELYRQEKMPKRAMTRQGYNTWLNHYIIPVWGDSDIQELQARPVDLWLQSLQLAPKSKVHIRGLIRTLFEYAMWRGELPLQRNPMELVVIRGASRRVRQPRSLTVEEFQKLGKQLEGPFYVIALVCASFGLRISECLALKWSDVDWLNSTLRVERGIVHQKLDTVKTPESQQTMDVAPELLEVLKAWKQLSEFSAPDDWVFASTVKIGRLPISYAGVWRKLTVAAESAGVGHLSSHVFRHSYRSWLDVNGTPVGVQQKLMRHSDVRQTMNVYGQAERTAMRQAHGKVVGLLLRTARETARKDRN